jgi:hypothetical protein
MIPHWGSGSADVRATLREYGAPDRGRRSPFLTADIPEAIQDADLAYIELAARRIAEDVP